MHEDKAGAASVTAAALAGQNSAGRDTRAGVQLP